MSDGLYLNPSVFGHKFYLRKFFFVMHPFCCAGSNIMITKTKVFVLNFSYINYHPWTSPYRKTILTVMSQFAAKTAFFPPPIEVELLWNAATEC